jgi:hypothetical protein
VIQARHLLAVCAASGAVRAGAPVRAVKKPAVKAAAGGADDWTEF